MDGQLERMMGVISYLNPYGLDKKEKKRRIVALKDATNAELHMFRTQNMQDEDSFGRQFEKQRSGYYISYSPKKDWDPLIDDFRSFLNEQDIDFIILEID
jgi:hypothetical protein